MTTLRITRPVGLGEVVELKSNGTATLHWFNTSELAAEIGIHRVNMITWLRNRPDLTPAAELDLGGAGRRSLIRLWSQAQVDEIRELRRG